MGTDTFTGFEKAGDGKKPKPDTGEQKLINTGNQTVFDSLFVIWFSALCLGFDVWITSGNVLIGVLMAVFTAIIVDLVIEWIANTDVTQPTFFWRFLAKANKIVLVLAFSGTSAVIFGQFESKIHGFLSQIKGLMFWLSNLSFYLAIMIYISLMLAYLVRALNFCNDPMLPEDKDIENEKGVKPDARS